MIDIADAYLATWNSADVGLRQELLARHWSPDVTYTDPLAEVAGVEDLSALMDAVRLQFPGSVFTRRGPVDGHHRQLRFQWGLGSGGGDPLVIGSDVLVLAEDGRIREVRGFLDKVPS